MEYILLFYTLTLIAFFDRFHEVAGLVSLPGIQLRHNLPGLGNTSQTMKHEEGYNFGK